MPPKIKRVSKYALGKTLGQGTFGKVKYAVDTETNTPVALKIMDKQKIKTAKIGPQIKKEIRVMKLLQHPTCIKLIEVLASQENIFLVVELVSGGELFDRVVANGRFSENEARKYFQQLIEGLEHCHSLGICHRDLKPENLLLDAHGGLKITDFGLASINETPSEPQVLHTPCGTPNYVAPEVLMEKGYDGCLADVWSAGVILYLLVSGFLPFDEAQMVDLFRKIVVADYQYPSWLSHEVQNLIGRMLEPNVDRRATISEIKQSPWYRGEIHSNKRKFCLSNDSSSINTDLTSSTLDDNDEMANILTFDDDQLIFGLTTFRDDPTLDLSSLLLSRQLSGRFSSPHVKDNQNNTHNNTINPEDYVFKKNNADGRERILVGDHYKDIREWFYEKYPGKRSAIDDNIRKERRAARKAAQQQQQQQQQQQLQHQNKYIDGPIVLTTLPATPQLFGSPTSSNLSSISLLSSTPTGSSQSITTSLPVLNEAPSLSNDLIIGGLRSPSFEYNQILSSTGTTTPINQHDQDDEQIIAPKQLNAFDLINMVSGQSVNNMLLFNGTDGGDNNNNNNNNNNNINNTDNNNINNNNNNNNNTNQNFTNHNNNAPNNTNSSPVTTTTTNNNNANNNNNSNSKNNIGIIKSTQGDVTGIKIQLKQTQTQHQQQSFTQFTSKCPTALLIKRLDYVLLHIPNVKYRINYKKCHINVVWTNIRNNHQVHEFIEVYSLTNELHMVRCQRMTGSGIAHGEFYRIFKDNVKFLESHSSTASLNKALTAAAAAAADGDSINNINNINNKSNNTSMNKIHDGSPNGEEHDSDIVVGTPVRPKKPKDGSNINNNVINNTNSNNSNNNTNSTPNHKYDIITEEDIDAYLQEWSQDVLIYKDYLVRSKLFDRQNQINVSGDIAPIIDKNNDNKHNNTTINNNINNINSQELIAGATTTTAAITIAGEPNEKALLSPEQMAYGLNTFRSLTLNSKSITTGSRSTRTPSNAPKLPEHHHDDVPIITTKSSDLHLHGNPKDIVDMKHAQESSSDDDDDDDSSSSSSDDE